MLNVILKDMIYLYKYTDLGKWPFAEHSPAVISSAEQMDCSAECTVGRSSLTFGEVSGAGGVGCAPGDISYGMSGEFATVHKLS